MRRVTRRDMLVSGFAGAAFLALPRPAFANWGDSFDTGNATMRTRFTEEPLLAPLTLDATRRGALAYADLARRGGWPLVAWRSKLSLGDQHPDVEALRSRLVMTADLDARMARGTTFDSFVDAAVRRFQSRHGLAVDGVAGGSTLTAANVPAASLAAQLDANITRLSAAGTTERRYVTVNVPSAEIELVQDGRVASRHTAVVGKDDRKTPLLTSAIHEVNFNPTWTVPKSIIRKDLIPAIRRDPGYLQKMRMRIFDGSWTEVQPETIDWSGDDAVDYFFRQDPGANNALGRVRINFANDFQVYLHDTPQPGLFGDASRFHSSGCVRVERIPEFIAWLLAETPGWDEERVAQSLRSGNREDVSLTAKIPVHFVYITAWSTEDLTSNFREDVYGLL